MLEAFIDVAQRRGYRVRWHLGGPKAAWLPHTHTICLRVGMDDVTPCDPSPTSWATRFMVAR